MSNQIPTSLKKVIKHLPALVIIENGKPLCQSTGCPAAPEGKQAFCRHHRDLANNLTLTLSGSEPPYTPENWNRPFVQKVHNCFAYALNILSKSLSEKCEDENICNTHQPGEKSKWPAMEEKTCPNLIGRILGDDKYIPVEFSERCPSGTSKIAFIIDTQNDYHVLRQDMTGYFSHKGGQGPVTNLDARGHFIADVRRANFNYSDKPDKLNYTHFCGYFCVSRSTVHAGVPNGGRRYQKTRRLSLQRQKQRRQKNKTRLRRQKIYR
jgi:hypothetical protein